MDHDLLHKKMRKVADYASEQDIDINNLHEKIKEDEIKSEIGRILESDNENFRRIALERSVLPIWERGNIKINDVEPDTDNFPDENIIHPESGTRIIFPLDAIRDFTGKVLIVRAGTGSGKSTQIPQSLLAKGKVILTQPRILTTVGIAERIANEMKCSDWRYCGVHHWRAKVKEQRYSS